LLGRFVCSALKLLVTFQWFCRNNRNNYAVIISKVEARNLACVLLTSSDWQHPAQPWIVVERLFADLQASSASVTGQRDVAANIDFPSSALPYINFLT